MTTPVIYLTILFSLGIVIGKYIICSNAVYFIASALIIYLGVTFTPSILKKNLILGLLIVLFGMLLFKLSSFVLPNDIRNIRSNSYVKLTGIVIDDPENIEDSTRLKVKVEKRCNNNQQEKASGKLSVFVKFVDPKIRYGDRIELSGSIKQTVSAANPGSGDQKLFSQMNVDITDIKILKRNCGNIFKALAVILKRKLISIIKDSMPGPNADLLGSIILGTAASPISEEINANYRLAGVIHLLVVSGTQVSIIISALSGICSFLGISKRSSMVILSFINFLFMIMTGAASSIMRASFMAEASMLSRSIGRGNDFYNSLSLSALIILLVSPSVLFDIGFQLSFLATWALFYLAPILKTKIADIFAVSLAPMIATSPIILFNFGQISFISIVSNALIVPWIESVVLLGFVSMVCGLICLPAAHIINNFLSLVLNLLNGIVFFLAKLPFACRYFSPPSFIFILLYYFAVIVMFEKLNGRIKIDIRKPVFILLLSIVLLFSGAFSGGRMLHVTFIDVGQGDSLLIETPSGKHVLIDGGGRSFKEGRSDSVGQKILVPYLHKQGINRLDYVILTHPHDDHVNGLNAVLKDIHVDQIFDGGQPHTSSGYYYFLKFIDEKKIKYSIGRIGQKIDLGDGVVMNLLSPQDPLISGSKSDLNENSIVIKLVYGKTSFLLTGDLGFEGERRLLGTGTDINSDVIKVGHHGSSGASSDVFLDAVSPKYAVISVGANNKFGHPAKKTINKLVARGITIYRTDLNGGIIAESDGTNISFKPTKPSTNLY